MSSTVCQKVWKHMYLLIIGATDQTTMLPMLSPEMKNGNSGMLTSEVTARSV